MSPPKRKKPPARKNSSTHVVQSNKATSYFKTPSSDSSLPPFTITETSSVVSYPVFNTAPADFIANFSYLKAIKTPISVTPISSMDRASLCSSNSVYADEIDDNGSGIDMDKICRGYQNPYHHCMERKWRKVFLHSAVEFLKIIILMESRRQVFMMHTTLLS